jgi:hypothetical protein
MSDQPYVKGTPVNSTPKTTTTATTYVSNVPVAHAVAVNEPEITVNQDGYPTLAGLELWIPPKPNVYSDGLPVYEVSSFVVEFELTRSKAAAWSSEAFLASVVPILSFS